MKIIANLLTNKGHDISKYNTAFIEKSIHNRLETLSVESIQEYCELLKANTAEMELLLDSFQINYSEFYRNSLTFSTLEKIILPAIIHQKKKSKNKEIRIWSSACAGGQEAYSLAILLEELLALDNSNISYRIFATDLKQEVIDEAQLGVYPSKAINNVTHSRLEKWFTLSDNSYAINKHLKNRIEFSLFDLLDNQYSSPPSSIFGNFDIVVCANLLFYYMPEYQNIIIRKANNSLAARGYIITGEAERDILHKLKFKEIYPQSAIYQK